MADKRKRKILVGSFFTMQEADMGIGTRKRKYFKQKCNKYIQYQYYQSIAIEDSTG